MAQNTRAELEALKEQYILEGGKRTTAIGMKTLFTKFIDSVMNILDDADINEGYLRIDENGRVDVSKISSAVPLGKFLKDDGTMDYTDVRTLVNETDDVPNVATAETDLTLYVMPALTIGSAGDQLVAEFAGSFAGHATATRRLRLYLGLVSVFDSGAINVASTVSWALRVTLVRKDSGIVKAVVTLQYGAIVQTLADDITGLSLSAQTDFKLTGTAAGAGAATNDIIRILSTVRKIKAAV